MTITYTGNTSGRFDATPYYTKAFNFFKNLMSGNYDIAYTLTTDDFKNKMDKQALDNFRDFINTNGQGKIVSRYCYDHGQGSVEVIGLIRYDNGKAIALHIYFVNGQIDAILGR